MPAYDAELGRIVRRYVSGLDRNPGATAPESLGNQALPRLDTGDAEVAPAVTSGDTPDYPDSDDTRPALRNSPNSFGWRTQSRPTFAGYREHVAFVDVEAGETATVRADAAANWYFTCAGNVTIELADIELEPLPDTVDGEDPPEPTQGVLVTVYVLRVKDATITWPGGIKWSSSVVNGAPVGPATGETEDVFTLMKLPRGKGWRAFVAGVGMA